MMLSFSGDFLMFILMWFLMILARLANFMVEIVSLVLALWGEQVTIKEVL